MRALDAIQGRRAAVGVTTNALTAEVSRDSREVRLHSSDSSRLRILGRTHLPQTAPACPLAKDDCLPKTEPGDDTITRPDYTNRPAPAKRNPLPGDDLTSASVSVPRRVRFAASCPPPPIRGSNQTCPLTSAHGALRRILLLAPRSTRWRTFRRHAHHDELPEPTTVSSNSSCPRARVSLCHRAPHRESTRQRRPQEKTESLSGTVSCLHASARVRRDHQYVDLIDSNPALLSP